MLKTTPKIKFRIAMRLHSYNTVEKLEKCRNALAKYFFSEDSMHEQVEYIKTIKKLKELTMQEIALGVETLSNYEGFS